MAPNPTRTVPFPASRSVRTVDGLWCPPHPWQVLLTAGPVPGTVDVLPIGWR